jgi:predicted lysophospholipase L1 biosynthesis ABC-type transport system permease subunit
LNVESEALHEPARRTSAETVAGYLSAVAIFVSLVGIAWHPLRLILPSAAVALIASGMTDKRRQLTFGAVLICAVALFLGFTVAVATSHPLW